MKVIICGAGQVGFTIASYLSKEGNTVTLIDENSDVLAHAEENLTVSTVLGHASHPDILAKAGAVDAEMIIAATFSDEVNMVACQVAHSLFNVPRKIARVRHQSYLDHKWDNLYQRDHLPIDVLISPEIEVAKSITHRLKVPGAFNIIPMVDGRIQLVSVICRQSCPLLRTPLRHLTSLFPDLAVEVVAIIRGDQKIIPNSRDEIQENDEVYFVTSAEHLSRAMTAFGYDEPSARRVLIVGGGKIGVRLAEEMRLTMRDVSIRLIESSLDRAREAAKKLPGVTVLHGDALKKEVLEEAHVGASEVVISVMNQDESNILVSMLAKKSGCERTIALVNSATFGSLTSHVGIDAVVNPREITVSTILQHVRRGRIKAAYSIYDGFAEILEVEALDTSAVVNTPLREIRKPKDVIVGLIVRDKEILVPKPDSIIRADDRVIILAAHDQVKTVESMFAVRPEFF